MNRKQIVVALLLIVSLGCHAGIKKRLKKLFPCVFAPADSESEYFSDSSRLAGYPAPYSNNRNLVYPYERGARNYSGWSSQLFLETGILPEDMAKNPAHPEQAAYERRIEDAME